MLLRQCRESHSPTALSSESKPHGSDKPRFNLTTAACLPETELLQLEEKMEANMYDPSCSIRRDEGYCLIYSLQPFVGINVYIDLPISTFDFVSSCI